MKTLDRAIVLASGLGATLVAIVTFVATGSGIWLGLSLSLMWLAGCFMPGSLYDGEDDGDD